MSVVVQGGWGAAPQDIIDSIIDDVANLRRDESDKQDLWNCSLVSTSFRCRSQSWLFRTLKIDIFPTPYMPIRERNALIHNILETNPRIASYVRSMSISILALYIVEDLQPTGTDGFTGSPLILPNLHELEIIVDAHYNVPFSHLSVELETELNNLIQSPQLRSISFSGIIPRTDLAALYKLNRLEIQDGYYNGQFSIRPSLRGLLRSFRNDERSLICLCDYWEPEKILFSGAWASFDLSMRHLKGYAVHLPGLAPEKLDLVQTALSRTSESLRSFSITFRQPFLYYTVLDLSTLANLTELEFIVDESSSHTTLVLPGNIEMMFDIWSFIQNTLMTLPPFNELTILKFIFPGQPSSNNTDQLAQLDDLLSNVAHFNMLQQVFISPLKDPKALPRILSRGILINDANCSV
ncbi:hypothetical protein E4T56_gene16857 [Termitomyces sp. T112]|nr:hypothetical protein E4T56_gene16857 [Termitomyces sp. T112]